MQLSKRQIAAFQAAYKADFGVELTPGEALDKGLRALRFVRAVAKAHARAQKCTT